MKRALTLITLALIVSTSGSRSSADSAQVYLTEVTEQGIRGLKRQVNLSFQEPSASAVADIIFDVDASDRSKLRQKMDGYGAALTEACTINLMKLSPENRARTLERMFSKTKGAGFDYIRLPIGASDFVDNEKPFYSYNDTPGNSPDPSFQHFSMARDEKTFQLIREAKRINPNLRVMISPWSPPAWMKTSNSLIAGSLKREHYPDFANYLVLVTREYIKRGIPVTDLTIQNEPYYDSNSYPSMAVPTVDQTAIIRDHVSPALQREKLPLRIFIMDHNWANSADVNTMLDDASMKPHVGGVAYHCYGGHRWQMLDSLGKHPDVATMQTECTGTLAGEQVGDMHWWFENQALGAVNMGTTGSIGWNLCLDETGGPHRSSCTHCRGMVTVKTKDGQPHVSFNGEFHALAQVSRFIRPGSRNLKLTAETAKSSPIALDNATAFVNADGGVVFVAHNPSEKPVKLRVRRSDKRVVEFDLPAKGAVTLTWN